MEHEPNSRTISDYANQLQDLYRCLQNDKDRWDIVLNSWQRLRKFSDDELQLLIELAISKFQELLKTSPFEYDEYDQRTKIETKVVLTEVNTYDRFHYVMDDGPRIDYFDLIWWLQSKLKEKKYPFENQRIDEECLTFPEEAENFEICERWAVQRGYIKESGEWDQDNTTIAYACGFLQALLDLRILKWTTQKKFEDTFGKRYTISYGDQLKPHKLKKNIHAKGIRQFLANVLKRPK